MAEQCDVSAWWRLNQLLLYPQMANPTLPKAAYFTEKYNVAVVSTYLTLVPWGLLTNSQSSTETDLFFLFFSSSVCWKDWL